jgi:hypothetical protein
MPRMKTGAASLTLLMIVSLAAVELTASTVVRFMNLEQMCLSAGRIFRGTVIGVTEGTVEAGGGTLATVVYRIRVDEAFKGTFEDVKGEQIATLQMVKPLKRVQSGPIRRLMPLFDDFPTFQEGHDYLILATAPSAAGLSVPVGLGQGTFKLAGKPGEETAVNANDNAGLQTSAVARSSAGRGPMPYSSLRAEIRRILGRR